MSRDLGRDVPDLEKLYARKLRADFRTLKLFCFENYQKRPFVHNSVCSQFLEGLFAILAECSQFCLRSF